MQCNNNIFKPFYLYNYGNKTKENSDYRRDPRGSR